MFRKLYSALLIAAALTLTACGGNPIKSALIVSPETPEAWQVRQVRIGEIKVTSTDQSAESLAANAEWARKTKLELQEMFISKNVRISDDAPIVIDTQIKLNYGNFALRHFVGWGAGKGEAEVILELKDKTGKTILGTRTLLNKIAGAFETDVKPAMERTITSAVKDFGTRLK
ncbi:hypothetical protein GCM10027046_08350 [Uliginosibacterium flavum]|uniref:DUF4410 domain-containing protein n=1 Tax=Uliginosibacterium flavum TaxID=1396831 RepID=A0ABV2TI09_9RHOO